MDLAILFIINNGTTEFDYINIQESTSNFLTSESNIDALGYPAYNDFKLTKTTGNFLSYLPFNNYFEATTYINHGNSGGAKYFAHSLTGLPTFKITSPEGTKYYFLKISEVKNWFENKFGVDYATTVLSYTSEVMAPEIQVVSESHNYGKFNDLEKICYLTFEEDSIPDLSRCFDKSRGKSDPFNEIQFTILKPQVPGISENGIRHMYYKFGTSPDTILDENFTKYSPYFYTQNYVISDKVSMDQQGIYYFSFFIEEKFP